MPGPAPKQAAVAVTSRSFSRHPTLRAELQSEYADVRFNDDGIALSGATLVDFLAASQKAIIGLERIDLHLLDALPDLKVISKYGVGLDNVDLAALEQRGVLLGWTGGVNKRSVSELVIALMITLLRKLPEAHRAVSDGPWHNVFGRQLSDCTVGIVGCGHVGMDLATLLRAFGTRVLAYDIADRSGFYAANAIEGVTLEELLARSDVVTLHVPLDESTRSLMNTDRLALMKQGACLVNAARGGLVDETALAECLRSGSLAGAACDVFEQEPPVGSPLLGLPTFIGTPHIGGSAEEAILAMGRSAIDGLDSAVPALHYASDSR